MAQNWWEESQLDSATPSDAGGEWWKGSKLEDEPKATGFTARLKQGTSRAFDSAKTALTDDENEIAKIAAEQARTALPQTALQRQMAEEYQPYVDAANKAEGVVDNVTAWGAAGFKRAGQLLSNPAETVGMMAEQLPNSLPGLAGGYAGMKAGAALGSLAGPVGTVVGGLAGGVAGGFLGSYGLEKGASVQEQVQKEAQKRGIDIQDQAAVAGMVGENYDEIEATAQRKGVGTAGTDAILNVATMGLASIGGRALAKEAQALHAAVKSGAMDAAEASARLATLEASNAARNTLGAKVMRGTGVVGAEMVGEGLSEAVGQKYAYGEVDAGEVIDESLLGFGAGTAMSLGSKAFNKVAGIVDQDAVAQNLQAAQQELARKQAEIDNYVDTQPEPPDTQPPQLGFDPDPLVVSPDGTAGRKGEAEQYVASLPEHQQNAARAKLYGYAPQPVDPPQPDPVRESVRQAADAGGALSAAAGLAMDSGASPTYMPPVAAEQVAEEPQAAPVVLQNRDRTTDASIAQMQEIAANPDYLRAGVSRDMTNGAPVVFGDLPGTAVIGRPETVVDGRGGRVNTQYAIVDAGDVIASNNADGTTVAEYANGLPGKLRAVAGNGRTAGLQRAYEMGTAGNYSQELMQDAANLGIDPQAVAGMQRPVLVRVMNQADITPDMGDRTNTTSTQKLSPVEQASNDARRFSVANLSFDERGSPTAQSINGFISAMPVAERGDMLNPNGTPTRQAVDRLMAATFKQAYNSDELVQLHAQATDPDARAVLAAAADASGVMAALSDTGEFDVRSAVTDAVKMAVNAARQGLKLSDVLQNTDFDMNPEAYPVATFLARNIRSPKAMAEGLRRWGQLALEQARIAEENQRQGGWLGPAPTLTREEIFARIGDAYNPTEQSVGLRQAEAQPQAQEQQAQLDAAPAQPAPLPVPGNHSGTPTATMGTRTEAVAGPGFGPASLKEALAYHQARKQQEAAQTDAPAQRAAQPAQEPVQTAAVAQQPTQIDAAQAWADMPVTKRKVTAKQAGLNPVQVGSIGKANWDRLNPDLQAKLGQVLADALMPQAAKSSNDVASIMDEELKTAKRELIRNEYAPPTSWVVLNKETGEVVMETFDRAQVDALNTSKYESFGARDYLEGLNRAIRRLGDNPDSKRVLNDVRQIAEERRVAELYGEAIEDATPTLTAPDVALTNEGNNPAPQATPKQTKAIERVNAGKAFFFSKPKAESFIANNNLAGTHEVVPEGKAFHVKAKAQQAAPEAPALSAYTPAEAQAQQAQQEQATKAEAARKAAEQKQAADEDDRKRIAAASVVAADTFELGQDPMDSLTGQKDVFADAGQEPEAAKSGPFDPIFEGFENNPKGAITKLMQEKRGEVPDAFSHPELGAIGFVYGNNNMGLLHIANKRGIEWVNRIPEILRTGELVKDEGGLPRAYLVRRADTPASVTVIRLDWDGKGKTWLVTAYPDDFGKFTKDKSPDNNQKHTGRAVDGVSGFSDQPGQSDSATKPTNLQEGIKQAQENAKQKFEPFNAVAAEYGYSVGADGVITLRNGKKSSLKVVPNKKGDRFQVDSIERGDKMFSGGQPEALGKFLEKFWDAKKQPKAAEASTQPQQQAEAAKTETTPTTIKQVIHKPDLSMADIEVGDVVAARGKREAGMASGPGVGGKVTKKGRTKVELESNYMGKPLALPGIDLFKYGNIQVIKPDGTIIVSSAADATNARMFIGGTIGTDGRPVLPSAKPGQQQKALKASPQQSVSSRATDQTQTEAFKRWFGGSKVVDPDTGNPLVMYHGTNASENGDAFTQFNTYASKYGLMGMGGYFTADPEVASSYTKKERGVTPTVYPVYLAIQNPLDMDAEATPDMWRDQFPGVEEFLEGGTKNENWYRAAEDLLADQDMPTWEGAEAMQEGLRSMGFDGITHIGGGRINANDAKHLVYIAFDPNQIKSAIGNNGNFDGTNPDIRFSFAGTQAATADKHALASAQQRLDAGEDAETVRQDTGWHKGKDGRWRFEISDEDAKLTIGYKGVALGKLINEGRYPDAVMPLADLLEHPALFAAYPALADMRVAFIKTNPNGGQRGSFDAANKRITLSDDMAAREALSTLLHEIQHGIQNVEGFALGWSPSSPYPSGMREAVIASNRGMLQRLGAHDRSNPYSPPESTLSEQEIESMAARNADDLSQRDNVYRRVAGEVEARNTQTRQKLTDAQRRATPPSQTADVADSDVIVMFNGKEMANIPMPVNAAPADMFSGVGGISGFLSIMNAPVKGISEQLKQEALASVRATVDAIRATWGNAPDVEVAFDMSDPTIPQEARDADLRQRSRGAAGDPEGFYFKGKVYLLASRLQESADAARVLLHESLGHHGLHGVFGDSLSPILSRIATMRPREVADKAVAYGLYDRSKLQGADPKQVSPAQILEAMSPRQRREAAEEVLATMAQDTPELGFVRRAVAAIRSWLRKHVPMMDSLAMTDDEIINSFILPARKWVQRSNLSSSNAGNLKFSLNTGKPADFVPNPDGGLDYGEITKEMGRAMRRQAGVIRLQNGVQNANGTGWGLTHIEARHGREIRAAGFDSVESFIADAFENMTGIWRPGATSQLIAVQSGRTGKVAFIQLEADTQGGRDFYRVNSAFPASEKFVSRKEKREGWKPLWSRYPVPADASGASGFVGQSPKAGETAPTVSNQSGDTSVPAQDADANPGIRFSRTPQWQTPQDRAEPAPATWQAPESSKWDEAVYNGQDRHVDTKRVQQAIEANNGPLADDMNVRQREELFHGRNAKEIKDFQTQELNPMLEQLGKDGIELPAFEEFLHARHAPEANKVMAERNPNQDMINAGRAKAAQEVVGLERKMATASKDEQRILKKAMDNAIAELNRWNSITPYSGSEESRLMLSGMSDAQAKAIMAALSPQQKTAMQRSAAMFDAIVAKNRAAMVEYGLESQDTIDSWASLFQSYVPLMREEPEGSLHHGMGTGEGFSIKGREVKSRTGSTRKVVDIVANLAMQREKTIVRGEKNRVTLTLLELAKTHPNPDFWKVGAPDKVQKYDPATKTVKWVTDPLYKSRDNVVVAKRIVTADKVKKYDKKTGEFKWETDPKYHLRPDVIAGTGKRPSDPIDIEEVAITFNKKNERAMRMAMALKNLDDASMNKVLQTLAPATRALAALSTQYNPSWGLFNFLRDTFGVMVSLGNTPLTGNNPSGESNRARIYKDAWKALPALYRGARAERGGHEDTSEFGLLWADFQKVGGAIGFRDMLRTSDERTGQLKMVVDPDAWMQTSWGKAITLDGKIAPLAGVAERGRKALFGWISDFNLALENATRVAVYKAGLEQGLSKERAASIAKNITVNFNRRGAVGHQIGAAYAFFNASVQGTARMAEAMTEMSKPGDPRSIRLTEYGKNILAGSLAIGAMQAVALAAAGFGDDEPPEFVRDRNIIIPTGKIIGPEKGYITIPLPLGYNIIPAFGRRLTEFAMSGGKDPFKHITGLMGLVFDGFNPVGSGSFTQMLAPTVLDPIIASRENRDSFGRPIARESLDANVPGHALSRSTATGIAKWLSESLNSISGGDKYTRGAISPSPDQIDYMGAQYAGGVGREIMKVIQSTTGAINGEDVPMHKIPLVGRLVGDVNGPSAQANTYYRNQQEVDKAEKRIKGLREDGKMAEAVAERQRIGPLLLAQSQAAERQVKTLRKTKAEMLEKGVDRAEIRRIEERMTAVMQRFNQLAEKQRQSA